MVTQKHLIGIFTRQDQTLYDWLSRTLSAFPAVKDVRTVFIHNDRFVQFSEEVSKCTFAILYHSNNRGKINVCDVQHSLYDTELEYLYTIYGKNKVLVVIDDVEDSSFDMKTRILTQQPNINKWANGLFLFSNEEKNSLNQSFRIRPWAEHYQNTNAASSVQEKLGDLQRLIQGTQDFAHVDSHPSPVCTKKIMALLLAVVIIFAIVFPISIYAHS
ncbi:uncharacterized protein LOC108701746 [Xenopus laevis]|uniref:Uncharacterized protein n=2 Tax=Xenopus laevis TaxID=8355 RepID=A0A974C1M5_XENLA|nr:uncharacterized protein LOC108701746 [Xenopus laevis]OCT64707.1 hypothetical protein XELAEV_18045804mg [Xenopus laevis]